MQLFASYYDILVVVIQKIVLHKDFFIYIEH